MKPLIRVFVLFILVLLAPAALNTAQADCRIRSLDYWCGLTCQDYVCYTPASQTTLCFEIPGGCGNTQNAECCPPWGPF